MLRAQIDRKLEQRFRELAMKRFGYGKGALSRAAEEALLKWVSSVEREAGFEGDPVEAIDGVLSSIKMNSVELQRRMKGLWVTKVAGNVPD